MACSMSYIDWTATPDDDDEDFDVIAYLSCPILTDTLTKEGGQRGNNQ